MYRSLSILFLSLISFCAFAQNDSIQTKSETTQQAGYATSKATESTQNITGTQNELLNKAAELYSKSQFSAAAEVYEKVKAQYGTSDKLYYNLGNAYYKSKNLPSAILNYERALRLNPADRDIQFNLEMCQARIVDKIDPIGMFMFARWNKSLENSFNSNIWAFVSIFFFLILITCLFAYFFARISWLKKVSFFAGILALCISALSLYYTGDQRNQIVYPDKAILFTPTVTVKSSPDQSGTDLFILHEGSKVTVLSKLGNWSEIELEDGNIGWIESIHLQTI
ncbi:MAG TPA: tetratricopeptide repeat protein [Bacteroidales bacterium]